MHITIAVDGSDVANRAVRYVAKFAASLRERPRIDLVFVDEPLMMSVAVRLGPEDVTRFHARNGRFALARPEGVLKRAQLAFESHQLVGEHPALRIIKFLKDRKCDLLVMGSHGRGALKIALLGSVTSKVLALSKVPVTIIR